MSDRDQATVPRCFKTSTIIPVAKKIDVSRLHFTLHLVLSHLDRTNTFARILYMDSSSEFNTIIPRRLTDKLLQLDINTATCPWILDFLTERPQSDTRGTWLLTVVGLIHMDNEGMYRDKLFQSWCRNRALSIIRDPSHPLLRLFELLPSGKRYRSVKSGTSTS